MLLYNSSLYEINYEDIVMDKPFINEQEKLFFRERENNIYPPIEKRNIRTEPLLVLNDPI